jgi:hypothetical protein
MNKDLVVGASCAILGIVFLCVAGVMKRSEDFEAATNERT